MGVLKDDLEMSIESPDAVHLSETPPTLIEDLGCRAAARQDAPDRVLEPLLGLVGERVLGIASLFLGGSG